MFVELGGWMFTVRERLTFSPEVQPHHLHCVPVSYDGIDRGLVTFSALSVLQALTFFSSWLSCHFLGESSALTASPTLFPSTFFFPCGTFLILSSRIIYLLWFLFLSVSLRDWKFYKGKDVCLCLLLNSQCLEWHPVHKEIFVEWMNALIPISECLLHPIPSGLEVIGLGFEYWLCHKLPLSLSKSLNLAAL